MSNFRDEQINAMERQAQLSSSVHARNVLDLIAELRALRAEKAPGFHALEVGPVEFPAVDPDDPAE